MNPQRAAAINSLIEAVGEARSDLLEAHSVAQVEAVARPNGRFFRAGPLGRVVLAHDEVMRAPLDDPGPPKTRTAAPLTSHWAARSMRNSTLHNRILHRLRATDSFRGWTVEELEQTLKVKHQTMSPRVNELRNSGWVYADGETRKNDSGREAEVYRLTARGRELLMEVRYG